MTLTLSAEERAMAAGARGTAVAMAARILADTAALLGAERLIEVTSSHVDGCLYHGDSGVEFAERLAAEGGRVAVPTTLNVGALDLLHPGRVRFDPHRAAMARRLMAAYEALGCTPSWTCAPYQAGHRPKRGEHVAWGESNAVVFCNSVLGARTNRLGDFLDICAALCARAPYAGLHRDQDRRARIVVDASGLSERLRTTEAFYPVLGAWLGAEIGSAVAAITGMPRPIPEDRLKALGAAAASSGAVGLFHIVGVTPEAPDLATATGGEAPERRIALTPAMIRAARDRLSTAAAGTRRIDAVAVGSPHFSEEEFSELGRLLAGRRLAVPFYACTGRGVLRQIEASGLLATLTAAGVEIVTDTCVVVAPILPDSGGVLMTNSGKFAHYATPNTGFATIYGSLADCVASAVEGRIARDESLWQ
ncbi:MAG TPA: aconitase X catalytic domain-containing protein [Stellaceae bacterium]|nr:aconitase X catalytic domain-containing protein [Stellaceae bacterium]